MELMESPTPARWDFFGGKVMSLLLNLDLGLCGGNASSCKRGKFCGENVPFITN